MKMFLKVFLGLAAALAIGVGILTYLAYITRSPSTILSNPDCTPACWHGIYPGKTTPIEALNILQSVEGVNSTSIVETKHGQQTTQVRWRFMRPVPDMAGYIYYENEQVSIISIVTINTLTLSDLLKRWGQPEKMWTYIGQTDVRTFLFYPSKGYLIEISTNLPADPKIGYIEISEKTPVFNVSYFDPVHFENFLTRANLLDIPTKIQVSDLRRWLGLGQISYK